MKMLVLLAGVIRVDTPYNHDRCRQQGYGSYETESDEHKGNGSENSGE